MQSIELTEARIQTLRTSINKFLDQLLDDEILHTMGQSAYSQNQQDLYILQNISALITGQQEVLISNLTDRLEKSLRDLELLEEELEKKSGALKRKEEQLLTIRKERMSQGSKEEGLRSELSQRISELQSLLRQKTAAYDKLQKQHQNALRTSLQEKDKLTLLLSASQEEVSELTVSLQDTKKTLENLRSSCEQTSESKEKALKDCKKTVAQLSEQLQKCQGKNVKLQASLQSVRKKSQTELQQSAKEAGQRSQESQKLRRELQLRNREISSIRKQNENRQQDFQVKILELEGNNKRLKQALLASEQLVEQNSFILEEQNMHLLAFQQNQQKLLDQIRQKQLQNQDMQARLHQEKQNAQLRLLQAEKQLKLKQKSLQSLESESFLKLQDFQKGNKQVQEQLEQANEQLELKGAQILKRNGQINVLKGRNVELEEALHASKDQFIKAQAKLKFALQSQTLRLQQAKSKIRQTEEEVVKLRSQFKALRRSADSSLTLFQDLILDYQHKLQLQESLKKFRAGKHPPKTNFKMETTAYSPGVHRQADHIKQQQKKVNTRYASLISKSQDRPDQSRYQTDAVSPFGSSPSQLSKSRLSSSELEQLHRELMDVANKFMEQVQTLRLYKCQLDVNDSIIAKIQNERVHPDRPHDFLAEVRLRRSHCQEHLDLMGQRKEIFQRVRQLQRQIRQQLQRR